MKSRKLFWSVLIILVLVILMELLLPIYFSQRTEAFFLQALDSAGEFDLRVNSFPSLFLLKGRVDRAQVEGSKLVINGLELESWQGEYANLQLPPLWQWGEPLEEIEGQNTFLEVVLKEEDLNNYLEEVFPGLMSFNLSLLPDQVLMTGILEAYGFELEVEMEGTFQLVNHHRIDFVPLSLSFQKMQLPEAIVDYIMEELDFYLDLERLPLPVYLTEVELEQGRLLIYGGE